MKYRNGTMIAAIKLALMLRMAMELKLNEYNV